MKIFIRRWLSSLFIIVSATLHAGSDSQEEELLHDVGRMVCGDPSEPVPQTSQHPGKADLKAIAVYLKSLVSDAPPASSPVESRNDDDYPE
ncbi:hypothetical protein [Pantoea coffeiphila]|uniref:Uncharacterized protein n=1 Tax=Pantoea coffeiphila TaxID=1465635 RepID=A0A2S9IDA1_9GAMM|nr:hypothetical protein [Pantoea coffeiphila]PRD15758.1 hypothetical protein CQW29_09395 [Pantoea coffeiphila]